MLDEESELPEPAAPNRILATAFTARRELLAQCIAERTDCFRLFHGTVEGLPGVTVDQYGGQVLVQSFHAPLPPDTLDAICAFYRERLSGVRTFGYHDRSAANSRVIAASRMTVDGERLEMASDDGEVAQELGVKYRVEMSHSGQDPLLFLDMRVGRRWMLAHAAGKSVLNLFAYTCGIGTCAAVAGASQVWNVDFAESALAVGRQNAALNGFDNESVRFIKSDCFPALQQLAGIAIPERRRKLANGKLVPVELPPYPKLAQREFDLVFMDPPKWAKSKFGTVDLVRDYQSLFKPALMATRAGGEMVVCNNVAQVPLQEWLAQLVRCGEKIGRSVRLRELLLPELDFPSFDNQPPLKIAVLDV